MRLRPELVVFEKQVKQSYDLSWPRPFYITGKYGGQWLITSIFKWPSLSPLWFWGFLKKKILKRLALCTELLVTFIRAIRITVYAHSLHVAIYFHMLILLGLKHMQEWKQNTMTLVHSRTFLYTEFDQLILLLLGISQRMSILQEMLYMT